MTSFAKLALLAVLSAPLHTSAFTVPPQSRASVAVVAPSLVGGPAIRSTVDDTENKSDVASAKPLITSEERTEKIGQLIADDEWLGLATEMTEAVRTAVVQDVKKKQQAMVDGVKGKTTEFIGKEEYKVTYHMMCNDVLFRI